MKKTLLTVATAALIGAMLFAPSHAESATSTTTTTTAPTTTTTVVPTTAKAPVVITAHTAPKAKALPTRTFTKAQIRYLSILHVNNLKYQVGNAKPALEAFRIVAAQRKHPWTPKEIKSWEIAISDIMKGESGYCPNTLRGTTFRPGTCIVRKQGRYEDAGFGQLIRIHYHHSRPGTGWLCAQEGLCTKWQIIASPWNSMTALVALIERSGTAGWCYDARARRHHRVACSNPGMDVG